MVQTRGDFFHVRLLWLGLYIISSCCCCCYYYLVASSILDTSLLRFYITKKQFNIKMIIQKEILVCWSNTQSCRFYSATDFIPLLTKSRLPPTGNKLTAWSWTVGLVWQKERNIYAERNVVFLPWLDSFDGLCRPDYQDWMVIGSSPRIWFP